MRDGCSAALPLFAAGFAEGFFAVGFCAAGFCVEGLAPLVGVGALAAGFAVFFGGFFAAVLAAAGVGGAGFGVKTGRVADVAGCVGCFVVGFERLKGRGNIDFRRFFTTHSTNEHPGH